ncbi:ribosome hibernation-promoting factor, HPF/YfiA family [Phosphitispora sp. TUW77]|uniref:ribosome hibernation-promoting factor, HPF/YfiA family n=1 Tax=Phosphitispora sp. TUW77 TaxID=3152361 RepID=UPI003AB695A9
MKIIVRGKNIEVTNALKDYVEKKLVKLEKYLDLSEAQVTLVVVKDTHKVEVTIPVNGMILRGEEATDDMYASVDLVIEKLEKQINKYKSKFSKKIRVEGKVVSAANDESYEEPIIKKTKRFAVKPMPVEEAVMQMNMLGHSFFVFSNAETEEVNVLYIRKDGNYGLIEPEF